MPPASSVFHGSTPKNMRGRYETCASERSRDIFSQREFIHSLPLRLLRRQSPSSTRCLTSIIDTVFGATVSAVFALDAFDNVLAREFIVRDCSCTTLLAALSTSLGCFDTSPAPLPSRTTPPVDVGLSNNIQHSRVRSRCRCSPSSSASLLSSLPKCRQWQHSHQLRRQSRRRFWRSTLMYPSSQKGIRSSSLSRSHLHLPGFHVRHCSLHLLIPC